MIVDRFIWAALITAMSTPALSHEGVHTFIGFSAGLLHPVGGLDHLVAMLAVGLLAARFSSRFCWVLPASFLAMMLVGGAVGFAGLVIPAAEVVISASVATLGVALALRQSGSVASWTSLVGLIAAFHGYAHGLEIPASAGAVAYSSGFLLTSAALLAAGIGMGRWMLLDSKASRSTGMAITLMGLALLMN
jgi:urease accessory protein